MFEIFVNPLPKGDVNDCCMRAESVVILWKKSENAIKRKIESIKCSG